MNTGRSLHIVDIYYYLFDIIVSIFVQIFFVCHVYYTRNAENIKTRDLPFLFVHCIVHTFVLMDEVYIV